MTKSPTNKMTTFDHLVRKYDVPVPRYTSYPTVPYWDTHHFTRGGWWEAVDRCFQESNDTTGISLYIHLPFCESLCTYCACNTRITRNHRVEGEYIKSLLAEWATYRRRFGKRPVVRELHLGGGTPTFFSPDNLKYLLSTLLEDVDIHPDHIFSFEGHPNNTTRIHLETLYALGFRRVSFGVQDLDDRVQRAINRLQPLEHVTRVVSESREIGYTSVSFDLVYGLPYQTVASVENTVGHVLALRPDRIAFYSYAHVPWLRPGQRGYEDADLPSDVLKRSLYETGREALLAAGYGDVGMDHFALPGDELAMASRAGTLHRNFMGYTTSPTDMLIGLGTSAISDVKYAYAQNLKKVEEYEKAIQEEGEAIMKGHLQTEQDRVLRACILDIACRGRLAADDLLRVGDLDVSHALQELEADGLITRLQAGVQVSALGRAFIRNICQVFDQRMRDAKPLEKPLFSRAI